MDQEKMKQIESLRKQFRKLVEEMPTLKKELSCVIEDLDTIITSLLNPYDTRTLLTDKVQVLAFAQKFLSLREDISNLIDE